MTPPPRLRSWFLRNLLEAAERELGADALAGLTLRAPSRVRPHLSLDRLRAAAALDAIPLDEGEDALLALDQTLGDGTGRLLERIAREMFARQLVQAAAAVRVGDLYGTVARLRGPVEHPFLDVEIVFELERTPAGFVLSVGVPGRPRATRVLRHLVTGAILAAERFARESQAEPLRIEADVIADRAQIEARFRRSSDAPPPFEPTPTSIRRSSGASRIGPSLSEEVARILDPSLRARAGAEERPADSKQSGETAAVSTKKPPSEPETNEKPSERATPPPSASGSQPAAPPPSASAERTLETTRSSVDPRAATLPALERASPKPPKG